MAKKSTESAAGTLYRALSRRNEVGIGVVEVGQEVDFSAAGWTAHQIACVVQKLYYAPVDELPADVQEELVKLAGG